MEYFILILVTVILALVGNNAKKLERIEDYLGTKSVNKDS